MLLLLEIQFLSLVSFFVTTSKSFHLQWPKLVAWNIYTLVFLTIFVFSLSCYCYYWWCVTSLSLFLLIYSSNPCIDPLTQCFLLLFLSHGVYQCRHLSVRSCASISIALFFGLSIRVPLLSILRMELTHISFLFVRVLLLSLFSRSFLVLLG